MTELLASFAFERPWVLALAVLWFFFWRWFRRVQVRALDWIVKNVSPRFQGIFTGYSAASFRTHMWTLLATGLLLVVAAAGPSFSDRVEVVGGGRVLVVLDASASMAATDVDASFLSGKPGGVEGQQSRFEAARRVASKLVQRLDEHEIAIETFSGTVALQVPMTGDRQALEDAVASIGLHNSYHLTGSSFRKVLESVLRFSVEDPGSEQAEEEKVLHVILVSDGEMPFEEDFEEALDAVAERGIPVHTLAVGSEEGQGRKIVDLNDIIAKKEDPRVIVEFHTKRIDEHLRRISEETGGSFAVLSQASVFQMIADVRERPLGGGRLSHDAARRDLAPWLMAAALLLFVLDTLWTAPPRSPYESFVFRFEWERIGEERKRPQRSPQGGAVMAASLALLIFGCEASPLQKAHRENERGIARDEAEDYAAARPFYERSIAYGVHSEVPTYNLGRSLALQESYGEAHEVFEKALVLQPSLLEAAYNDGVDLYLWGAGLYDPRGCNLERTRELWQGALKRFDAVVEEAGEGSVLGRKAKGNRELTSEELNAVEILIEDPPPECEEEPPPPPPPEESPPPPPDEGQPPPPDEGQPPPPPPPDEGLPPPLTDEQRQQIQKEVERVATERSGKTHRRGRPQQYRDGDLESIPEKVWW